MAQTNKYELIGVLVNPGFTDAIIEAARKNGATGGTIINAKGKSNKTAEKKYGLVIAPDKDLILILVNVKSKAKVMETIHKVSGIETKGMAIIFSLPTDNVVGIRNANKQLKAKK